MNFSDSLKSVRDEWLILSWPVPCCCPFIHGMANPQLTRGTIQRYVCTTFIRHLVCDGASAHLAGGKDLSYLPSLIASFVLFHFPFLLNDNANLVELERR